MGEPKEVSTRLTVDGEEYWWEQRHAWLVDRDKGLKGLSVAVAREPGRTRELILDFSFETFGEDRRPAIAKVSRAVANAIPHAIEAGWEPESRGRSFRYEVGEGAGDESSQRPGRPTGR
jgi:hypothetical protein